MPILETLGNEAGGGGGSAPSPTRTSNSVAPVAPTMPMPSPGLFEGLFGSPAGTGGNPEAAKAAALRGVDIEKRRLDHQLKTGLRDIGQARDEGLQAAINNALQRGIYNSGIRMENEAKVKRESGEAASDLKTDIGFALELLKERANSIKAGGGGQGVGGGGFSFTDFNNLLDFVMRNSFQLPTPMPAPTINTTTGQVSGSWGTNTNVSGRV